MHKIDYKHVHTPSNRNEGVNWYVYLRYVPADRGTSWATITVHKYKF